MNFLMKQGPPYRELEMLWRPYKEGRIQINLQVVDRSKDHLLLSERLEDIFSQRTLAQKYTSFTALGAEEYVQNRYCNMLTAMSVLDTPRYSCVSLFESSIAHARETSDG